MTLKIQFARTAQNVKKENKYLLNAQTEKIKIVVRSASAIITSNRDIFPGIGQLADTQTGLYQE